MGFHCIRGDMQQRESGKRDHHWKTSSLENIIIGFRIRIRANPKPDPKPNPNPNPKD